MAHNCHGEGFAGARLIRIWDSRELVLPKPGVWIVGGDFGVYLGEAGFAEVAFEIFEEFVIVFFDFFGAVLSAETAGVFVAVLLKFVELTGEAAKGADDLEIFRQVRFFVGGLKGTLGEEF